MTDYYDKANCSYYGTRQPAVAASMVPPVTYPCSLPEHHHRVQQMTSSELK
ncbi:hypothetical protein ABMX48_00055 [Streptomyces cavourensis]